MAESASYSLREAAYVVDLPFDRLEKASERGEVLTSTRLVKGRKVRVVPKKELVLFRYSLDHRQELPKTSWSTVQARFRQKQTPRFTVVLSEGTSFTLTVAVDLRSTSRQVDEREQKLRRLRDIAGGGDDPLLKGTDIPLYRLAALVADDGDISRAKAAFPSLDEARIRDAAEFARLYPKKGRPYPDRSLKETLTSLDLSDVPFEQDDENNAPREVGV